MQFPWRVLVFPPLVPLVAFALLFLSEALGAELNIHGGAGIVLGLIGIWSLVTFFVLAFAVPRAYHLLMRHPEMRSTEHVLATGFASLFMMLVAGYVLIMWIHS